MPSCIDVIAPVVTLLNTYCGTKRRKNPRAIQVDDDKYTLLRSARRSEEEGGVKRSEEEEGVKRREE